MDGDLYSSRRLASLLAADDVERRQCGRHLDLVGMNLTYNPASGHVKRDGAIIGTIRKLKQEFVFTYYRFASDDIRAASVEALLPQIRDMLKRLPL
jgi:hypothetical protein